MDNNNNLYMLPTQSDIKNYKNNNNECDDINNSSNMNHSNVINCNMNNNGQCH